MDCKPTNPLLELSYDLNLNYSSLSILMLYFTLETILELTAVLIPDESNGFVAMNPETGTHSQGESIEEALTNLKEATELYLEEFPVTVYGKPMMTTMDVSPAYAS